MDKFNEIKNSYKVRVDVFSDGKSYISKETFNTYEEAWNYGKKESKNFGPCGFCVINFDFPELSIDFSVIEGSLT